VPHAGGREAPFRHELHKRVGLWSLIGRRRCRIKLRDRAAQGCGRGAGPRPPAR
jgi:hypothetical protein